MLGIQKASLVYVLVGVVLHHLVCRMSIHIDHIWIVCHLYAWKDISVHLSIWCHLQYLMLILNSDHLGLGIVNDLITTINANNTAILK